MTQMLFSFKKIHNGRLWLCVYDLSLRCQNQQHYLPALVTLMTRLRFNSGLKQYFFPNLWHWGLNPVVLYH